MTDYRRAHIPGATWFFTVNLARRKRNNLLVEKIVDLRAAFQQIRVRHPFHIDAVVILPEHLHCIWTLPPGDANFAARWGLIKGSFSRGVEKNERISPSRAKRSERGIWQRRFWEHLIRDGEDFNRHVDYIHWNPVKHGWVKRVADWPYSSFHDYLRRGIYPENWAGGDIAEIGAGE
jgi:REP-associated tyrosine transposase